MAPGLTVAGFATFCVALGACRVTPARAIDPELEACVPPGAQILAGAHLDQVRANTALQKLSADWLSLLDPGREATSVVVVYTGTDLLWAARGEFRAAPSGATLLTPRLAVSAPAGLMPVIRAQQASGRTGALALVKQAEQIAGQPVWAVVPGTASLPVSGNAANLDRLLGLTDYTTVTLDANAKVGLHAAGICRSAERARQLEESIRGLLSLAGAALRDRDLASLLGAVQVRREDLTVRADVSATPEVVEKLLRSAAR